MRTFLFTTLFSFVFLIAYNDSQAADLAEFRISDLICVVNTENQSNERNELFVVDSGGRRPTTFQGQIRKTNRSIRRLRLRLRKLGQVNVSRLSKSQRNRHRTRVFVLKRSVRFLSSKLNGIRRCREGEVDTLNATSTTIALSGLISELGDTLPLCTLSLGRDIDALPTVSGSSQRIVRSPFTRSNGQSGGDPKEDNVFGASVGGVLSCNYQPISIIFYSRKARIPRGVPYTDPSNRRTLAEYTIPFEGNISQDIEIDLCGFTSDSDDVLCADPSRCCSTAGQALSVLTKRVKRRVLEVYTLIPVSDERGVIEYYDTFEAPSVITP